MKICTGQQEKQVREWWGGGSQTSLPGPCVLIFESCPCLPYAKQEQQILKSPALKLLS